jgi:2-pyrone-4,6-dicarboxylate lactonase
MRPVQRPDPNTKKPKLIAPPAACDTHLHVYGPTQIYPLATERNYTPDPRSTLEPLSLGAPCLGVGAP